MHLEGEISAREQSQLHGARRLRNVYAHNVRVDGSDLATPAPALVELILRVAGRLSGHPPTIGDVAVRAWIVRPDSQIGDVLGEMRARDFSQVPYRTGHGWAMFTMDQVARWLWLSGPEVSIAGVTVADVAEQGPWRPARTVKARTPTQTAVDLLIDALESAPGDVVPALLVEERSRPNQIGIFTASDLHRALRECRPLAPRPTDGTTRRPS